MGDSQRVLGLVEEAERSLLRSLALTPAKRHWLIQIGLAQLLTDAGRFDEAETWYAAAIAQPEASDAGWSWVLRGINHARSGMLQAAEACHRRAATLSDVDRDEALLNLGYVLRAQGRYAEAAAVFREAVTLDPHREVNIAAARSLDGIEEAVAWVRELPPPPPS